MINTKFQRPSPPVHGQRKRPAVLAKSIAALMALCLVPHAVHGQTWTSTTNGDWNTAANWNPATVPNGSGVTATFDGSSVAKLSLSADTEVSEITFTANATFSYTITVSPSITLTISGTGISDSSGVVQNLVTAVNANGSAGGIYFSNGATAGDATITNQGATLSGAPGGFTAFDGSSAGDATIVTSGGANGGGGSATYFYDGADGGTAQAITNGNGIFDVSGTTTMNIGSIAGSGAYDLGGSVLTVGGNNLSTTVTGVIADGGYFAGTGGSLVKTGTGTLTLAGANTYTGATTISTGTLQMGATNSLPGNTAVTVNTGATLALNGFSQTIGSIADGAAGGGAVSLGSATLTTGHDNTTTSFSGVISGAGGLTKVGIGWLTLSGANTYSGATTVNSGILMIDTATNPTVLNPASALVLGGGMFQLDGYAGTTTQVLNGLTVNKGSSEVIVNNLGTTTTLDLRGSSGLMGITHNAGGFVDFEAGLGTFGVNAFVLTNQANDASGIIGAWATVNDGTALAANNGSGVIVAYTGYTNINALGPNKVPNTPAANLEINAQGTSGPVSISASTTNINTLTQNFTTPATIDTSPGTLRLGATGGVFITPNAVALSIGIVPGSGILTAGGATANTAGTIIFENNSATAGSLLTVNSVIANNGSGVVSVDIGGTNTTAFAAANTYTGSTTISTGTLQLNAANIIPSVSAVVVNADGILNLNSFSQKIASIADGSDGGGTISLGSAVLTTGGNNASAAFSGLIQDGGAPSGGSLVKVGTGTLTLSGASTYTGGTTLANGGLYADSNTALGTGTLTITSSSGPTTLESHVNNTSLANPISVQGNFSINSAPGVATNLYLTGGLDLTGGTRTITGLTNTEQVQLNGTISNGGITFNTVFTKTGYYVAFSYDGSSANTYTGLTTINNGAFLVFEGNTANGGIVGNVNIEGNGVIDYLGGAAQQLTPTAIVTDNSTGNSAGGIFFAGLDLFNSSGETIATLNGTGTVGLGAAILTVGNGSFSGQIFDTNHSGIFGGGIAKISSGTLLLKGASNYTGNTSISAGTLETGANYAVSPYSSFLISAGATFDLDGHTEQVGSIADGTGSGTISLGSGILVAGFDNTSTTFSGLIQDGGISPGKGGSFIKVGTGTLTLRGANTYTGPTDVDAGTLEVDGSLAAASTVVVATTGTLTGAGTVHGKATLTGSGVINLSPGGNIAGTLGVTGGNWNGQGTVGGLVTSSLGVFNLAGTLTAPVGLAVTGGMLAGAGTLAGNLSYTSSAGSTFDGVIVDGSVASTLTMNHASSILVLTGSNTYSGTTTITAGTLQIGNGGTAGQLGTAKVVDNGILTFDLSSSPTVSNVISGLGVVNQSGAGTTILSGVETYTGATSVTMGTLEVDGTLAAGSIVNVATSGTLTGTGTIKGKATLTGNGSIDFGTGGVIDGTLAVTGGNWTGVGTVVGVVTSSSSIFNISDNLTITAAGGLAVTGGTIGGTGTLTGSLNDTSSASMAFGGVIAGPASTVTMNKASSTLTLTGTNTYGGATTISAGTLQLGNGITTGSSLGNNNVTVSGTGALALDLPGGSTFANNVNLNAAGATLKAIQTGTNTITFSGLLSGTGTVSQSGAGTTILSGVETYTGATSVTMGTLEVDGTLAAGSIVNVATGGTLTGAGTIKGKATLTGNGAIDFSTGGVIDGTLAVTGGNWTGVGTVVGSVTSSASVFNISDNLAITAAGGLTVTGGTIGGTGTLTGSLNDTSSTSMIFGGVIAGPTSTVTMNKASSTLTLTGTNTYGGATTIGAGTLQVGNGTITGATLSASAVTIGASGTLTTDLASGETFSNNVTDSGHVIATGTSNNYTVSSLISGTGNLTKTGANIVTVTSANTYTGGTTISAGTLLVNNSTGSGTGTGPVTVNNTGTLGGSGTISGATTLNSGGTIDPSAGTPGTAGTTLHASSLTWNGGGTLTLQLADGGVDDALALTGALTKGTGGTYTLDLINAGLIGTNTYNLTLVTFASSAFTAANFNVELPLNYTGTLVKTNSSLEIENLTDPPPASGELPEGADLAVAGPMDSDLSTPAALTVTPTPEPGSAVLLALGASALLGWRRRRV